MSLLSTKRWKANVSITSVAELVRSGSSETMAPFNKIITPEDLCMYLLLILSNLELSICKEKEMIFD